MCAFTKKWGQKCQNNNACKQNISLCWQRNFVENIRHNFMMLIVDIEHFVEFHVRNCDEKC